MKIQLTNFQGHKDSTVETFGGITALTGSTSAGKSSFIRAIQHLKDNSLRGDGYVRKGQDTCTISLDTTLKVKSKKDNYYLINGDKKEALRTNVPIEVTQALNLSSECIQTQHNSIFLLNKTPGQVAAKLSELIDLDTAHRSIRLVDQERKSQYGVLNALNASIIKRKDKIKSLESIDTYNKELGKIERKLIRIQDEGNKLNSLRKIVDTCIGRLNEKNNLPDVSKLSDCNDIIEEAKEIVKEGDKLSALKNIVDNYNTCLRNKSNLPDISKLDDCTGIIQEAKSIIRLDNSLVVLKQNIDIAKQMKSKLIQIPSFIPNELQNLKNDYKVLDKLRGIIDNAKSQINVKEEFSGIEFTEIGFNESMQSIKYDIQKMNTVQKVLHDLGIEKKSIENNRKRMNALNELYKEKLGDTCPTCGSMLK